MPRLVTFGDNVVDCYADRNVMLAGGNAPNVAAFAARAGAAASYVGAVADDPAGRHIRSALVAESVDVSHLRIVKGHTAFCLIGRNGGEREFLGADLGVSIIAPTPEDLDFIAGHDVVHTGRSSHVDAHLPGFAARTLLSYDFAVIRDHDRIGQLAPHCFLASFSAGDLGEEEAIDLLRHARAAGARWCLATRGRSGALLDGPTGVWRQEALPIEPVDTLGAGDAFIARVLVGLVSDEQADVALPAAAAAAAETCRRLGAFGPEAPLEVDRSRARTLEEIYADSAEGGAA